MTKKNLIFILAILLVTNFLTRGPDAFRALNTPAGKWFSGQASWFDPWDINLYFSAIGWGQRGGLLFENLYDSTSSAKMPVFFLYTALGKLGALFGLSNPLIFHLGGVLGSIFLAGVIGWFLSIFLTHEKDKRVAFALIFLGGGLGWLFFPKLSISDLATPGFTIQNALRMAREAISLCLLLLSLGTFYQALTQNKSRFLFYGAIFAFLMLTFHPYSFVLLGATFLSFGFYSWLKTGSTRGFWVLLLLAFAGLLYYFLIGKALLQNPSFSGQVNQLQPAPSPLSMLSGWGILSPLVLIALLTKPRAKEVTFLKIWFLTQLTVLYLPFHFQKLLIRGLWVAAVMLAVLGLNIAVSKVKWSYAWTAVLLVVLATFSTIFMTYQRMSESAENRWIYLSKEEGQVIEYLRNHGENKEGVLASYRLANIIPAHTSKKVFAGHEFQTPNFEERIQKVNRFYAGQMSQGEAEAFLKGANVTWIFWGPDEKAMANLGDIPHKNLLRPVLETPTISLYAVAKQQSAAGLPVGE